MHVCEYVCKRFVCLALCGTKELRSLELCVPPFVTCSSSKHTGALIQFSTPLAGLPGTLSTGKQERTALFRQAIADAERAGIWKLLQVCGDA